MSQKGEDTPSSPVPHTGATVGYSSPVVLSLGYTLCSPGGGSGAQGTDQTTKALNQSHLGWGSGTKLSKSPG